MRKFRWILLGMAVMLPLAAQARDAYLSMIYTNALNKELPFAIFSKGEWTPDPLARFVKLHMYFDEPIFIKGMEIDSCGTLAKDDLSVFFNFDQWLLSLNPKMEGEVPEALYPTRKGKLLVFEGFKKSIELRSMTFNFEHNYGFKICGIRLLDSSGQPYTIKTPLQVDGTVAADSVLDPATAYDPLYLFDSRFEYGWASNKKEKDVSLKIDFQETQHIEKFRIWNGYQRSVSHYLSNSRPKHLHLTGDNGYSADIEVADQLGSQLVTLPTPFNGKQLNLMVTDSVTGNRYKDLVISEIRFFNGKEWFMLNPVGQLHRTIAENRAEFTRAGLNLLLNDSYEAERENEEDAYVSSKLRLRADGSMYISGYLEDSEYFALGNYEIKEVMPGNGIKLRLFGLYYETEVYGDCNGCGRDCNKTALPKPDPSQKIFQEFVTIRPVGPGKYELLNSSGGKKLKFNKLTYTREK